MSLEKGQGNGSCYHPASMNLRAGLRLGPYEIVAPLGAGGMGEVWRARDSRLERDVAIKVLPPGLADDEHLLALSDLDLPGNHREPTGPRNRLVEPWGA